MADIASTITSSRASAVLMNGTVRLVDAPVMLAAFDQTFTLDVQFKNIGYYAAGAVWEEWISTGAPSITPPSGHALTNLQHFPLG